MHGNHYLLKSIAFGAVYLCYVGIPFILCSILPNGQDNFICMKLTKAFRLVLLGLIIGRLALLRVNVVFVSVFIALQCLPINALWQPLQNLQCIFNPESSIINFTVTFFLFIFINSIRISSIDRKRNRMHRFFKKYYPHKLKHLNELLYKYAGNEKLLFVRLWKQQKLDKTCSLNKVHDKGNEQLSKQQQKKDTSKQQQKKDTSKQEHKKDTSKQKKDTPSKWIKQTKVTTSKTVHIEKSSIRRRSPRLL